MAQHPDNLGNTYSASSAASISAMNAILEDYLGSKNTVMPMLDQLLEDDPMMPMAQCLRGYLLKMAGDPRFNPAVKACLAKLNTPEVELNAREQLHVDALQAWAENQMKQTVNLLEQLLADHPRDMLALRVAHYLHFYAGDAAPMRDSVARAMAQWDAGLPWYGYLLGMQSFGMEESGDYAAAEDHGRRAIAANPADIWAAHAVTHVFQMQARYAEGIDWIDSLVPHWQNTNNFTYHLHWHQALCYLGEDNTDAALAIYDARLEAAVSDDFYLDTCNASSLLWRLEMLGVNVGDRWQALREYAAARVTDDEMIFSTLHYLMVPARLKDTATLDKGLAQLDLWSQQHTTQGEICRAVGLPVAHALAHMSQGNHSAAARDLASVADDLYLIGGSHAQRDLFTQLQAHCNRLAQAPL